MSSLIMTVIVDDFHGNHLGDKEAVMLALEPLGWARVLRMETQEPEQIRMREYGKWRG